MKKIISVFIVPIVLLICSCTGQSLRINRNDIILQKSDTILQKIAFDSFELKEKKVMILLLLVMSLKMSRKQSAFRNIIDMKENCCSL